MDYAHRLVRTYHRIVDSERIQTLLRTDPRVTRYTRIAFSLAVTFIFAQMANRTSESSALERFFSNQKPSLAEFQTTTLGLGLTRIGDDKLSQKIYRSILGQTSLRDAVFLHRTLPLVIIMESSRIRSAFDVYGPREGASELASSFKASDWREISIRLDSMHQLHLELRPRVQNLVGTVLPIKQRSNSSKFEIHY